MNLNPKDIKENQVLTLVIPEMEYQKDIIEIVKAIVKNNNICYIALNKTHKSIHENLKRKGIDDSKFYFIDGISQTIHKNIHDEENVSYVDSPSALTDLSLHISDAIKKKKAGIIIFDSLSTLLIYQPDKSVTRFVHSIINKVREYPDVKIIFTILKEDLNSQTAKDMGMLSDYVTEL